MSDVNLQSSNNILPVESKEDLDFGKSRIRNMGNTCYMNSIIQCINHTPLLREYILNSSYIDSLKKKVKKKIEHSDETDIENAIKSEIKNTVIYQLHRIMKIMWSKDCIITPASFRRMIGKKNEMFSGYMQHDSQEFLIYVLDQIHEDMAQGINVIFGYKVIPEEESTTSNVIEEEIKDNNDCNEIYNNSINNKSNVENKLIQMLASVTWRNYIRKNYSIITELFTGLYHSVLESNVCHNKSHAFDPFMCMPVSIPVNTSNYMEMNKTFTIYECLDNFFKQEEMNGDNKVNCDRCCRKTDSTKKISIWFPPKILIIQLKRFLKNPYGFTTRKINNRVTYPIKGLDLYNYTSDENKKSYKYNLFGINIHSDFGGINSGHYYSYCKNTYDNKWYCYNDEHTREVTDIQHKDAYLLFYYLV
jgi:ubiquitin C-terminal hydrolase